ncbi:hypothetical protein G8764_09940 [Pseudomaricurvus alcaniphilus]|uniref:hypothetical protein n=1 Tax=Pseudomaricurvus alcaniphilus TaxID=1166482 RepID=UPI00140A0C62|nr:hypothetical protein [Pseudomaricurvus alcaniphilus]NHN37613.1 hypothetical protein [Pseudomaricurvus alcaniphilus]
MQLAVFFAVFLGSLLFNPAVRASTVMQVDLDYLLQHAELVFEGEVIASNARWNNTRTGIFTHVTFQVNHVIKGEHAESTLVLQFAGGQVGDVGLQVGEMEYPELGEKGIYFVESTTRQMVNPLVGWTQGHFLLLQDADGTERVVTRGRAPVQQVMSRSRAAATSAAADRFAPFSKGMAAGLQLGQPADLDSALDRKAFRDALRQRLNALEPEL